MKKVHPKSEADSIMIVSFLTYGFLQPDSVKDGIFAEFYISEFGNNLPIEPLEYFCRAFSRYNN